MIPIPVYWTKYTATFRGQTLKLVQCENCSTEYVYVLEREGAGVGTSIYMLNEEGACDGAMLSAEDTLQSYLNNDFDPVPCPVCGHYQRYMFPKLLETKSMWGPLAMLVVLLISCVDAVSALFWSVSYLQRPNEHDFWWMVVTWSTLLLLSIVGISLWLVKQTNIRRFDPNLEDQQLRIAKGRSRAIIRAEFEKLQQEDRGPEANS